MSVKVDAVLEDLRALGLSYPGVHRKSPVRQMDAREGVDRRGSR